MGKELLFPSCVCTYENEIYETAVGTSINGKHYPSTWEQWNITDAYNERLSDGAEDDALASFHMKRRQLICLGNADGVLSRFFTTVDSPQYLLSILM